MQESRDLLAPTGFKIRLAQGPEADPQPDRQRREDEPGGREPQLVAPDQLLEAIKPAGGSAATGSSFKCRSMSAARPLAVS